MMWRRRQYAALLILILLLLLPSVLPLSPYAQHPDLRLQGPSFEHFLGTDFFGRDIFSRLLLAISNSLQLSVLSVFAAVCLGLGLAAMTKVLGKIWIRIGEACIDTVLVLPLFLVCLVIISWVGNTRAVLVFGQFIAFVPLVYRLCIREIHTQFNREYIHVAQEMGLSSLHIIIKHVFPFLVPKLYQQMISLISIAIGIEAGFSYLGFGIQKPEPSLGNLLYDARNYIEGNPWYSSFTMLSVSLLLFCVLLIADKKAEESL